MLEQTNPAGGVAQEAPSLDERMQRFIAQSEDHGQQAEPPKQPEKPEPKVVEQPEGQAVSEELTPDDIPTEGAVGEQPEVDAFHIVHNGQEVKLSRAEAIAHAQQGFDYTRKAQAVAEDRQRVTATLQRLQETEKVVPLILKQLGEVQALEAQVKQYENVDWVSYATTNPLEYPAQRARFDQLREAFGVASNKYQQAANFARAQVGQVNRELEAQEIQKIPELIPEWRDQGKREAGIQELAKHYASQGIPVQALSAKLSDAYSVAVAYKAMKYDQLVKAKTEKVKQLRTAPPVTRPGASNAGARQSDQQQKLTDRLRKTGDVKDAAALLLNRWASR